MELEKDRRSRVMSVSRMYYMCLWVGVELRGYSKVLPYAFIELERSQESILVL